MGTQNEPFLQKATITLVGDRMQLFELPVIGNKVLGVSNKNVFAKVTSATPIEELGFLDIHGQPHLRTWTKMALSALKDSTTIVLAENVDWTTGDKIVVTCTTNRTWTEEVSVVSRGPDNRTLTITPAFQFDHISQTYTLAGMRAAVGLLSHNVVVQGDDHSAADQYGVHTIAANGGTMRIENAEYRNCGQAYNLGRYCIHWHVAAEQRNSYVQSTTIHHSNQRAVVAHAVNNLRIAHNFAYRVMGHAFFVEDGIEKNNIIEENLAVNTLQSFTLLESDTKPAAFWTSTPSNFWRHNVAVGCTHDGYWLELPPNPGGSSFTTTCEKKAFTENL